MEFIIDRGKLTTLIEKGGLSSLSKLDKIDVIPQAILITVSSDSISFYSHNELTTARFSFVKKPGVKITCQNETSFVVQGGQFAQWARTLPSSSRIKCQLVIYDKPEITHLSKDALDDSSQSIIQVGKLKLLAKNNNSGNIKWELDAFDPKHIDIQTNDKGKLVLQDNFTDFIESYSKVKFAGLRFHNYHIFDSLCMEKKDDILYWVTTDTSRCTVFEYGNNFKPDSIENKLLIPMFCLNSLSSSCKNDDLLFNLFYNQEKDSVTFEFDDGFSFITKTAPFSEYNKFPSCQGLLSVVHEELATLEANVVKQGVATTEIANPFAVKMFIRKTDQNNFVFKSKPEDGRKREAVFAFTIDSVNSEYSGVFGVEHLKDIQKFNNESILFSIPMNKKWIRVSPKDNKKFNYFIMELDVPNYADCTI